MGGGGGGGTEGEKKMMQRERRLQDIWTASVYVCVCRGWGGGGRERGEKKKEGKMMHTERERAELQDVRSACA